MTTAYGYLAGAVAGLALWGAHAQAAPFVCATTCSASGLTISEENQLASAPGNTDLTLFFTNSRENRDSPAENYNADDSNSAMPTGANVDNPASFSGYYMTTIDDLRDFYNFYFSPGSVNQITLFLGMNQINDVPIVIEDFAIIRNADSGVLPNPSGDLTSAQQNAISGTPASQGGTVLRDLDLGDLPGGPWDGVQTGLVVQGQGGADWMIETGLDPFDDSLFSPGDTILFYIQARNLTDGAEILFISNSLAPRVEIPEPAILGLFGLGLLGLGAAWRRPNRTC